MWYSLVGPLTPVSTADFITFITAEINQGSKLPLTLYISCMGGDFQEGLRLYDFLKAIPNSVETVACGSLDFNALLPFLAGDKRIALTHCQFDLYLGVFRFEPQEATLQYHQSLLDIYKTVEEKMKRIAAEETGHTSEEIEKLFLTGKTLFAEEAKEFGIAHTVSDTLPMFVAPEDPVKN